MVNTSSSQLAFPTKQARLILTPMSLKREIRQYWGHHESILTTKKPIKCTSIVSQQSQLQIWAAQLKFEFQITQDD